MERVSGGMVGRVGAKAASLNYLAGNRAAGIAGTVREAYRSRVDKLDTMRLFARLAELGSFSEAARTMGVSQSAVSKQLARMEASLGAQLMRRTTRGLSLTEPGRDYYESVKRLLDGIEDVETRIGQGQLSPSGLLRIAMPASFGRLYVLPFLGEFLALYPEMQVDFDVSDRHANLVADGLDLAIRVAPLADSSMVARRIGRSQCITVGSPSYFALHGMPVNPRDIERMPCVVSAREGATRSWAFQDGGVPLTIEPMTRVRSNDIDHVVSAVTQGVAMAHAPGWLFADELESGRVIRVLEAFTPPAMPISVLVPSGRRSPRKVQVFADFLASKLQSRPHVGLVVAARVMSPE